tara:strand:+ start:503 stop:1174 length:672 start_codon:yes stop_codon:yes gene_type:complete
MSQIGTMPTTAGDTLTLNLPYCPQYVSVGNTYAGTLELTNFSVSINGQETVNLVGADNIDAVAQARRQVNSQDAAGGAGLPYSYLEITDGFISAPTLIRLTNEGTTANIVYGVSSATGTAPYRYSQFTINATSNQEFSDFDSLMINDSASIDSIEIQWIDGYKDRYSYLELPVLFGSQFSSFNQSMFSAGGDISFINNEDGNIANATIYTNATSSVTVNVGRI